MTQALSISLLGSKTSSLWRSLKTWWGFLSAWYHLQTCWRPRVDSWWESSSGFQHKILQTFTYLCLKFMIFRWRGSWKPWQIINSNQLMSGWMFHQIKVKTSSGQTHSEEQGNPLRFQLPANSPQPLNGLNVRARPECEPASHTQDHIRARGLILFQTS